MTTDQPRIASPLLVVTWCGVNRDILGDLLHQAAMLAYYRGDDDKQRHYERLRDDVRDGKLDVLDVKTFEDTATWRGGRGEAAT